MEEGDMNNSPHLTAEGAERGPTESVGVGA